MSNRISKKKSNKSISTSLITPSTNDTSYSDMTIIIDQLIDQMPKSKIKESPIYSCSIPKNIKKNQVIPINEIVVEKHGNSKIVNVGDINIID